MPREDIPQEEKEKPKLDTTVSAAHDPSPAQLRKMAAEESWPIASHIQNSQSMYGVAPYVLHGVLDMAEIDINDARKRYSKADILPHVNTFLRQEDKRG